MKQNYRGDRCMQTRNLRSLRVDFTGSPNQPICQSLRGFLPEAISCYLSTVYQFSSRLQLNAGDCFGRARTQPRKDVIVMPVIARVLRSGGAGCARSKLLLLINCLTVFLQTPTKCRRLLRPGKNPASQRLAASRDDHNL